MWGLMLLIRRLELMRRIWSFIFAKSSFFIWWNCRDLRRLLSFHLHGRMTYLLSIVGRILSAWLMWIIRLNWRLAWRHILSRRSLVWIIFCVSHLQIWPAFVNLRWILFQILKGILELLNSRILLYNLRTKNWTIFIKILAKCKAKIFTDCYICNYLTYKVIYKLWHFVSRIWVSSKLTQWIWNSPCIKVPFIIN